jgi:hypothetical protein
LRGGDTNAQLPIHNRRGSGVVLLDVRGPTGRYTYVNCLRIKDMRDGQMRYCETKNCHDAYAGDSHMHAEGQCAMCHDDEVMARMLAFQEESGVDFGLTGRGGVLGGSGDDQRTQDRMAYGCYAVRDHNGGRQRCNRKPPQPGGDFNGSWDNAVRVNEDRI